MIIVKYQSCGMKSVVKEGATRQDFSRMYKKWKEEAKEDEDMYVSWLGPTTFEVTNDRWADGYIYQCRPDDWPCPYGEPQ